MVKFQTNLITDFECRDEIFNSERYLVNYNKHIVNLFCKYLSGVGSVIDFGAGSGALADIFTQKYDKRPLCIEIDSKFKMILNLKGFSVFEDIDKISEEVSFIYSSNVLEHIEDDISALKELNAKLMYGGYLAVYVPAFQMLYSEFDLMAGHYRRYQKLELLKKMEEANFEIVDVRYVDSVGFIIWALLKLLGKFSLTTESHSQPSKLLFYDKYILPITKILDLILFRNLFGKNILIVGRRNV